MLRVTMRMSRLTGVTLAASAAAVSCSSASISVCEGEKVALSPKEVPCLACKMPSSLVELTGIYPKFAAHNHPSGGPSPSRKLRR